MSKKFYHGIMFHYFHNGKGIHKKTQGSIDKNQLSGIIKKIGRKNILDADIFLNRHIEKKLKPTDVCFTFDDGLKSQVDIALPVLNDYKIKSFFFVGTSQFTNETSYIELFRFFRNNFFKNINQYYNFFYKYIDLELNQIFNKELASLNKLKSKFPYYSIEDLKFRMIRDKFLTKSEYEKINFKMFKDKNFQYKKFEKKFYMNKNDLKIINKNNHIIGLHSHSQFHRIGKLSTKIQLKEYKKNICLLSNILNRSKNYFKSMSHPNGSYSSKTLEILKNLGIELGFKQIMTIEKNKGMKKINNSPLEIARKPHNEF
ncbi:polysaccharide deacetylase family protein [Candidatus Pelagibacter sp.]|nr:polysaccharide deacetylase family protein [Candidatus Pelagibacter sp.]